MTHHGNNADQHRTQSRADRNRHGHEAEVEEEQVDAHQKLGGHEADVIHKVCQDTKEQHEQHEECYDDALCYSPGHWHFWVQLSARDRKNTHCTQWTVTIYSMRQLLSSGKCCPMMPPKHII